MLDIINDILDIARIEAGQTEMREAVVDIWRCLTACVQRAEPQAQESASPCAAGCPTHLPA